LPIWLISLGLAFYAGYKMARPEMVEERGISMQKERDSLARMLTVSKQLVQISKDSIKQDSIYIVSLELENAAYKAAQQKIHAFYEKAIARVIHYNDARIDSFFRARYPAPGVRQYTYGDTSALALPDGGPRPDGPRFDNAQLPPDETSAGEPRAEDQSARAPEEAVDKDHAGEEPADDDLAPGIHDLSFGVGEVEVGGQEIQTPAKFDYRWRYCSGCWCSYY